MQRILAGLFLVSLLLIHIGIGSVGRDSICSQTLRSCSDSVAFGCCAELHSHSHESTHGHVGHASAMDCCSSEDNQPARSCCFEVGIDEGLFVPGVSKALDGPDLIGEIETGESLYPEPTVTAEADPFLSTAPPPPVAGRTLLVRFERFII